MSERRLVPRLMLVIDSQRSRWPALELATAAAAGGVDAIYLRNGDGAASLATRAPLPAAGRGVGVRVSEGLGVKALTTTLRVHLEPAVNVMINQPWKETWPENVGLHLRERDVIPCWSRGNTARPALIGRSVHSPESAAASTGVDYLLVGHVFPSASKPGKPPLGLEGLASIVAVAPCPVIAIGGITTERVAEVLHAGAHGVAVIGAIAEAADPCQAARSLRTAINDAHSTEFAR